MSKRVNTHGKYTATAGGVLLTLGIVFGDIGTSPLYVIKAIIGVAPISRELVFGGLSCVFWTLTFQTTIKYVMVTLRADNRGEGGIFALYTLVRRRARWLYVPAIIGGAALLADGVITPSISVTSAIEGLRIINPDIPVVPIVLVILSFLFLFQRFGTRMVGNLFGPIMLLWFGMLAILGIKEIVQYPQVLYAIHPSHALYLLLEHPGGFWLLGAVFLCTTGAEALYSDLGHCGKSNIRVAWAFVKVCLLLNYFGQGAWLTQHTGSTLEGRNPFFFIMPDSFVLPGIIIATAATVIASQALISGSYTLISEAMRLNFWPKVRMLYPTIQRGQVYIPSVNYLLFWGCVVVVLLFQRSENMEAAYGLSITITMLMTTILLWYYMIGLDPFRKWNGYMLVIIFFTIEITFLAANLEKFPHGGWFTLIIGSFLLLIMLVWFNARKIKNRFTEFVKLGEYLPMLRELSEDQSVPKYATNLVYLTSADYPQEIESKVMYSIFNKQPKRADMYWFIHVHVEDEPHTKEYNVKVLVPGKVIRVEFRLGFRVEPRINVFFKKVVSDMVNSGEIEITSRYLSLKKHNVPGDFRFVVIERVVTYDYDLPIMEDLTMDIYRVLKEISLTEAKAFELDTSVVAVEKVPLILRKVEERELVRKDEESEKGEGGSEK